MAGFSDYGVVCRHDKLEWLVPVLRRWGHFIDDYCACHPGDAPYFYSEWTNVGILAAAAWGPGGGSVQEYACRRGTGEDSVGGRADLYLYGPHHGATVEAKQLWGHSRLNGSHVNECFVAGTRQAITNRDSDMAVAAVFLTVKVRTGSDRLADARAVTRACRDAVRAMENSAAHAWAWAFPPTKRMFVETERASDKTFYWPGIVLGLRLAHGNLAQAK